MKARKRTEWKRSGRKPIHYMTVDPGLAGTGWAVWAEKDWAELVPPVAVGIETPDRHANEDLDRGCQLFHCLQLFYRNYNCHALYVEWPSYRQDKASQAAAARGDLGRLFLAASVAASVAYANGGQAIGVSVPKWKGQLPKEVVEKRIVARLGKAACSEFKSHVYDAVGIGLYLKGHF